MQLKIIDTDGFTVGGMRIDPECNPIIKIGTKDFNGIMTIYTSCVLIEGEDPVTLNQIKTKLVVDTMKVVVSNQKELDAYDKAINKAKKAKKSRHEWPEQVKKKTEKVKRFSGIKIPDLGNGVDVKRWVEHKILLLDIYKNHPEVKGKINIEL